MWHCKIVIVYIVCIILNSTVVIGQVSDDTTSKPIKNSPDILDALQTYIETEVNKRVEEKFNQAMQGRINEVVSDAIDKGHFVTADQIGGLIENLDLLELRFNSLERKVTKVNNDLIESRRNKNTATNQTMKQPLTTDVYSTQPTIETVTNVTRAVSTTSTYTTPPTSTTITKRLGKPKLDLNLESANSHISGWVYQVAGLSNGGAIIHNYIYKNKTSLIWKIDQQGLITNLLYTCKSCSYIEGLMLFEPNLILLHSNGTIVKIAISSGQIGEVYKVDVGDLYQYAQPAEKTDPNLLLLSDYKRKEIFTYNLTDHTKSIKLKTGLLFPVSVYKHTHLSEVLYVVCDYGDHKIKMYNSTWGFITQFGGLGYRDGQLWEPYAAIPSPNGHIIVADTKNNRISMFNIKGQFLGHLFKVIRPYFLYVRPPFLWVSYNINNIYRLQLYEN